MADTMVVQQFEVAVELPLIQGNDDFVMPMSDDMEHQILKALSSQSSGTSIEELLRWAISTIDDGKNLQGKPIKRLTCLGAAVHRQSN